MLPRKSESQSLTPSFSFLPFFFLFSLYVFAFLLQFSIVLLHFRYKKACNLVIRHSVGCFYAFIVIKKNYKPLLLPRAVQKTILSNLILGSDTVLIRLQKSSAEKSPGAAKCLRRGLFAQRSTTAFTFWGCKRSAAIEFTAGLCYT